MQLQQGRASRLGLQWYPLFYVLLSYLLNTISCACMQEIFSSRVDTYIRTQKRHKVTIDEGWYSKEEMTTELKWNKRLVKYIYIYVIETRVRGDMLKCFAGSVVRNRIEGAIKKCREDPENLIRLGILGRIYFYIETLSGF